MSASRSPAPRQRCRGIPDGEGFRSVAAATLRAYALTLNGALIALVMIWQLWGRSSLERLLLSILLTLPLWAPVRGLMRGDRRTYAWATLCVIPYFVLGLTETIANPTGRAWSATCLALALLLFVGLIGYLRVSRDR